MKMKHWQDPINALLGIWLIVSPWALRFSGDTAAMANFVIVGILLLAAALGAMYVPKAWEEWTESVLGLWMIISPWVLGFSDQGAALANFVIVGILLLAAALGAMYVPQAWEEWCEAVLGAWMIISPWIVGYPAVHAAKTDAIVIGIIVLILGFWAAAQETGWQGGDGTRMRH